MEEPPGPRMGQAPNGRSVSSGVALCRLVVPPWEGHMQDACRPFVNALAARNSR